MADTRKTVAIIGAGPSGLSTARSMLARNIAPTLFEAKPTLGGLWSSSRAADILALDPGLTLNHSRYTCAFSDLAWPDTAPMFPPVTEMGQYLERYREKYIPESALRLSCPVTAITKDEQSGGWNVEWRDTANGANGIERFDFLAVCSGFFSAPYVPPIPGLESFGGEVVHSADFTKLDLAGKRKIVVVGGSMTGIEAAADLALQLASLPPPQPGEQRPEIVHLFSRPFWGLAKHFAVPNEADPTAPRFLPLDLLMYDFNAHLAQAGRPPKPMDEIARAVSERMKGYVGHDQAELSPELRVTEKYMQQLPWVAISDSYSSFVREGAIKTVLGRVAAMADTTLALEPGEDYSVREIAGADAVVLATGYHPAEALRALLPAELYAALAASPPTAPVPADPNFAPLLLYNLCLHPALGRTAGFVGMYKGPYFGIMEMQGRWLSALFAGDVPWPSTEVMTEAIAEAVTVRSKRSDTADAAFRPQWVAGDYLGVVADLRARLSIPPAPDATSTFPNPMIPAHLSAPTTHPEATAALADLHSLLSAPASSTRLAAAAVFRALHGTWRLTRRLTSRSASLPSGTFTGTATFHPRHATFASSPSTAAAASAAASCTKGRHVLPQPPPQGRTPGGEVEEYLYTETGTFRTDAGLAMSGARSYIYRYHPREDALSVWFVRTDGSGRVDSFFHDLEFLPPGGGAAGAEGEAAVAVAGEGEGDKGGWRARGEHLCVRDWYWPGYRFVFRPRGAELDRFWTGYRVRGPGKDYTAEGRYER